MFCVNFKPTHTLQMFIIYFLFFTRILSDFPLSFHFFKKHPHSLSGGAFLGFYHMGVVRALWTEGLLPRVISGASAGSIMTAIIG